MVFSWFYIFALCLRTNVTITISNTNMQNLLRFCPYDNSNSTLTVIRMFMTSLCPPTIHHYSTTWDPFMEVIPCYCKGSLLLACFNDVLIKNLYIKVLLCGSKYTLCHLDVRQLCHLIIKYEVFILK